MVNASAELQSARAAFNNGNIEKVAEHVERIDQEIDHDCSTMVDEITRQANRKEQRQDRLVVEKELNRIERRVERAD